LTATVNPGLLVPAFATARWTLACGLAGVLAACSATVAEEGALARGDQAWVAGDVEEALAEYRLSLQQGNTDAEVYARIGHAYAELGKIDEAGDYYHLASDQDSAFVEQAVADLVRLARAAENRGDRFGVAAAMEASLEFRPGVSVAELALPLARYYSQSGEYGRALPFYAKALANAPVDTTSDVVFETGLAHEQVGDCQRALVFYEQFAEVASAAQTSEVSWRIGECSYLLATRIRSDLERARREGIVPPGGFVSEDELPGSEPNALPTAEEVTALEEVALMHLERTITLGEPRNRQAQAYFEKGELLAARGECDAAVDAFRQVGRVDPSGTGTLVARARERIDEIRFGPPRPDPIDAGPRGC
jgi:tetratricopeptide (TPR) repeat protein